MGDEFPVTRVAAVQAAPVFLDREASVAKACRLIAEAGSAGANLAVFGETWLPGYPIWLDVAPGAGLWNHQPAKAIFTRLVANAVEVPGPVTEALERISCWLLIWRGQSEPAVPVVSRDVG